MSAQEEVKRALRDHLTFYHEVRTPQNPFFDPARNRCEGASTLVVSSPSRMGNHLLMSVLDGHPQLPRTPGEDGLLMFSFLHANQDLGRLLQGFRDPGNVDFLMDLASNGGGSKWGRFKQLFESGGVENVGHAGVGGGEHSAAIDFEGLVFDIDFDAYRGALEENSARLAKADRFEEILRIYLGALARLDPSPTSSSFQEYIVYGAMRTQLKWLCETHPGARILSSIRSFPSYAISQIKSRHGDVELTDELVDIAWQHWLHKVMDAVYLAVHFPDQFGIVLYDDLVSEPESAHRGICKFLDISYSEKMATATAFGHPVRGNSWKSRSGDGGGSYYVPPDRLENGSVPELADLIWEQLQLLKASN